MPAYMIRARNSTVETSLTCGDQDRPWLRQAVEIVRLVAGASYRFARGVQKSAMKNNIEEVSLIDSGKRSDG